MTAMVTPEKKRQGWCKACEVLGPLDDMEPVGIEVADLGTLLAGNVMCRNEQNCLRRYARRTRGGAHLWFVVLPAEEWGAGDVILITGNPRRAHQHAAAMNAAVVRQHVDTDYRK